ncbi:hypothetical protein C8A06_0529 [Microbacteriaceae bacterium MWH-Ta3]|nr:hypothetical protein C8A06_0529 [Microbacteriaceae bacterium MWH-Ta3]
MIGEFGWETLVGVVLGLVISCGALWGIVAALDALMNWVQPNRRRSQSVPPTDNEDEVYHRFHDHR